ncbi:hypothetical protein GCM10022247_44180 [Allokutzneria multivorans]|uniref:Uncharacterized protein n=1 Tax=Allokutzneria multivorans TaxID=1142134 RepID=A0ABP7STU2_9PSEU
MRSMVTPALPGELESEESHTHSAESTGEDKTSMREFPLAPNGADRNRITGAFFDQP